MTGGPVSRRWVLRGSATIAGGLALGCFALRPAQGRTGELPRPAPHPGAWIELAPDGRITARCPYTEIGQGIHTLVAAIVAEELALDPAQVAVAPAPVGPAYANPAFGSMTTGGSTSARGALPALQLAGAALREMLQAAAAQAWDCPPADCEAADGAIRNRATGARLPYGALAAAAAALPPPQAPAVRPPSAWRILGRPQPRIDSPAKLRGAARYGIDIVLPFMLHAAIVNCPTAGGRLRGVDPAPALAVDGVSHVLPLEAAIIVVAQSFWTAERAAALLRPDWQEGPGAGLDSAAISARLQAALDRPGLPAAEAGDPALPGRAIARTLHLAYEVPPLAHAALEPPNATVRVGADRVEVWAPTQAQDAARVAVAAALGRPPGQVAIHTTLAGGSFGRNLDTTVIVQAALAARAAGRPVKLIWSRSQDLRHDSYRPPAATRIAVGLDAAGWPLRWEQRLAVPDLRGFSEGFAADAAAGVDPEAVEGADDMPYAFPHRRLTWAPAAIGLPVGWWRSVGHSFNAWFVEHAIDEVAALTGHDPIALRRALLQGRRRHLAVLEKVQSMWHAPPQAGRFRGTALHASFGSVVAQSLEISLPPDAADGAVRVHHVNCALDCGLALDPDAIAAQMEGGTLFGLTAALHGEIALQGGRVQQGNFDSYRLLPLVASPTIDVAIVAPADAAPAAIGGIGEAGVPPAAPALCNAVLAATGQAVRRLPLRLR